jgi:N-acetylglucosamine-6-sulfatase
VCIWRLEMKLVTVWCLLLTLSLRISCGVDAEDRPNILVLLTDDQDVVLGTFDHMPNVQNLLIEQGTTFENAFVHTPICCPSRSSILSGRYLHNGAAHNNSLAGGCSNEQWKKEVEPLTYAVHAQQAGYTTAYAGKYLNQYGYNGSLDVPPGWNHWFGLVGNSVYYNYSVVESNQNGRSPKLHKYQDSYATDYLPDVLKNHTLKLLNDLPEPWLVVVAWPTPHAPFTAAPWAVGKLPDVKAPRTLNYNASRQYMQQKHWLLRQLQPLNATTAAQVDLYYQKRLEALLSVDEHVGLLMKKVEDVLNHTLVLYTSDNGFQFGQHRLAIDKRHLYENDIRVPWVMRGPEIRRNHISSAIALNIDIAPTIVDIAKGSVPKYMDGISLLPYLRDENNTTRRDFLVTYNGEGNIACGLANCPMPQGVWWMPDSLNNTYHCVRTLSEQENSIYCRFDDAENFVEYYNLTDNPWQLHNQFYELNAVEIQRYEQRLGELQTCQGPSCRPD